MKTLMRECQWWPALPAGQTDLAYNNEWGAIITFLAVFLWGLIIHFLFTIIQFIGLSCKIRPWQKVAPRTIFCRKIWPPRPILAAKSGPPLQNLAHPPNCSLLTLTIHFWETEKAIDSQQAWRSWWSLWFLSVLYKLSGHLSLVTLIALNNFCAVIPWALVVC